MVDLLSKVPDILQIPGTAPSPSTNYLAMLNTMTERPLILITNDDGIESPGLHAAAEALLPLADLIIAAPEKQQSATGCSLRAAENAVFQSRTIDIGGQKIHGWCLDASPATTVRHAIQCLCGNRRPDMVVSGINFGENLGTNVTISGTVGAALQAAAWDLKALAVSLEVPQEYHYYHGDVDWSEAILILRDAVTSFLVSPWPADVHVIKIDIPDTAARDTPWHVCRQSLEPGWWGLVPDPAPHSPEDSTVGRRGPRPGKSWMEDDDMSVIHGKKEVAITPLSLDLSSRVTREEVERMFRG
jgi:5'-nucleotidase